MTRTKNSRVWVRSKHGRLQRTPAETQAEAPAEAPQKKYKCCNCTFYSFKSLLYHKSFAHGTPWVCEECGIGFAELTGLEGHYLRIHPIICETCSLKFAFEDDLEAHQRETSHCYCKVNSCQLFFDTEGDLAHHNASIHADEFRCMDCDAEFSSNVLLLLHLVRDHSQVPRTCDPQHFCKPCNLEFPSKTKLRAHNSSAMHNPKAKKIIVCISPKTGSKNDCTKKFKTSSGMIQHLESGGCSSGINRKLMNKLIAEYDTDRVITKEGEIQHLLLVEAAQSVVLNYTMDGMRPQTLDASAPRIVPMEADSDSDEEDGGVPILTPTGSMDFGSGVPLFDSWGQPITPTDQSSGPGQLTPNSDIFIDASAESGRFYCPICPVTREPFRKLFDLQQHLASSTHSPPMFYCPVFSDENDAEEGGGNTKEQERRAFKSIGSMVQHIESGACKNGMETFKRSVEYLQGKLLGMGLNVKLVA